MLFRLARRALLPFALVLPAALHAQPAEPTRWLYVNSDVPQDTAWLFGTLPNGLRYAIRRNEAPPGQVSVRLRLDVGSLHERGGEQGFAHFIEHLSFRGSAAMPELESKRVWQRLGVTFGSDSNASTTPTETVYKLDLPSANAQSLGESLRILAAMMDEPKIDAGTVDAERQVVLAEKREQLGPAVALNRKFLEHFFAGQALAVRPTIGTDAALTGATAKALTAFHDRWYRPERAVLAIAGDMDPVEVEALVKEHFEAWRGEGGKPREPDFGRPKRTAAVAATLVEPSLPSIIQLGVMRPWKPVADTVVYNEGLMVDAVAARIINRKLEARARAGGSFLAADVEQEDVSRSADATFVRIQPLGEDWRAALKDVRAVIAAATTTPPSQAEIDREVEEFDLALLAQVENEAAEPGRKQAEDLVRAIDIRETVTTPQGALDIFRSAKRLMTPARMLKSTRQLFSGTPPRILLTSAKPIAGGERLAAAALRERVTGAEAAGTARPVSFADVPALGAPAEIGARARLGQRGLFETVELSNGVKLILFPNQGEPGKVYVQARFGNGYKALPRDKASLGWSGPLALVASGIGDLGLEELDRLTNGRKITLAFGIEDSAFLLAGETRAPDLADQLKLMAAKLESPGWDAAPVVRARAQLLAGWELQRASPSSVLLRELDTRARGGDSRWAPPSRTAIEALTPEAFRVFWEPLLTGGPVEVQIFGDFDPADAIEAARASFGAMKARPAGAVTTASTITGAAGPGEVRLGHAGAAEQAAVAVLWSTKGGLADIAEARRLEVLAAVFNDRLFDRQRQLAGASYSPQVSSAWPTGMSAGGYLIAFTQLKPEAAAAFQSLAREIAADLAAKPIDDDELQRALGPIRQQYARARTSNVFWLRETAGATRDPLKIAAMESLARDLNSITPAELQAVAKRYLLPERNWSMVSLPENQLAGR